jgi:RNA polymerase sigma-70 factor (ECF subfamily)
VRSRGCALRACPWLPYGRAFGATSALPLAQLLNLPQLLDLPQQLNLSELTVRCIRTLKYISGMSASQSDYELAQAISQGTVSCVADLYERHRSMVYSLCLRMTGNVMEAEDLTQEVFVQLLKKAGSFRGESKFSTWLYRLTINQVLMYFRSAVHRRESPDLFEQLATIPVVKHRWSDRIVDRLTLHRALAKLPPGSRSIFVKFDVEGYNHEEIALIFGCSTGNSKSQLHKARRKLRKLLG